MRVICQTIDEFLENLDSEKSEHVLQKIVRVGRVRRPLDGDKLSAVKFAVILQASAVVDIVEVDKGNIGQYLLEVGELCGTDYEDSSKEMNGTNRADELRQKIADYCISRGLSVRSGVIDM